MPIDDEIFCIPVGALKTNENTSLLSERIKNWVSKVLVVGWGLTVILTLPTAMVLAMFHKQPELAIMLAKTGGLAGLATLSGVGLKKMWTKKPSQFNREESDDEIGDC